MTAGRLLHRRTLVLAALVAAIGAIVLTAFLVHQTGPSPARAADHLDAPGLTPPPGGDGIGTDLTDIYAFRSPADASKTVLIMNVNGLTTADLANPPGPDRPFGTKVPLVSGNPNVSYNFRIDTNGDALQDVNVQIRFGKPGADGVQLGVLSNLPNPRSQPPGLAVWHTGPGAKQARVALAWPERQANQDGTLYSAYAVAWALLELPATPAPRG